MISNRKIASLLSLTATTAVTVLADSAAYDQNAGALANGLASLFQADTGLFYNGNDAEWWPSANALTSIIDLMAMDETQKSQHTDIITSTFANAPNNNPHATRKRSVDGLYMKEYRALTDAEKQSSKKRQDNGFLNGFYDDEGWWALAWIDAYDLTSNDDYLSTAMSIWDDIDQTAFGEPCGGAGGIWWDRKHSYIASISNELFLTLSASLANRITDNNNTYLTTAIQSWTWLKTSGLQQPNSLFNDGFDLTCTQRTPTWSYTQGVILGGLVELYLATSNATYLDEAQAIANAAIIEGGPFVTNGIMHEVNNCDATNTCGADGNIFKGVFVRNLRKLNHISPTQAYANFFEKNSQSIWNNGIASIDGQLMAGVNWAGPQAGAPDVGLQSSALDCINGAVAVGA